MKPLFFAWVIFTASLDYAFPISFDYGELRKDFQSAGVPTEAELRIGMDWGCHPFQKPTTQFNPISSDLQLFRLVKVGPSIKMDDTFGAKPKSGYVSPGAFSKDSEGWISTTNFSASEVGYFTLRMNQSNKLLIEMSNLFTSSSDGPRDALDSSIAFPNAYAKAYLICEPWQSPPSVSCGMGYHPVPHGLCCPNGFHYYDDRTCLSDVDDGADRGAGCAEGTHYDPESNTCTSRSPYPNLPWLRTNRR